MIAVVMFVLWGLPACSPSGGGGKSEADLHGISTDASGDLGEGLDAGGRAPLTDRSEAVSRLEMKADDWIPKKCEPAEVTAKIEQWLHEHDHCLKEGKPLFRDGTIDSGILHWNNVPEFKGFGRDYALGIGGGVAVADFNGDGWLDVYATNWSGGNRLFLNRGKGKFLDCTDYAGVAFSEDQTNGASAADYDNDGDQDLYVDNSGDDRFLENKGDAQFDDVTDRTGIRAHGRSATTSWGDLDADGDLDLVVASNLEVETLARRGRGSVAGSGLYENTGDGSFVDRTIDANVDELPGRSSFIISVLDLDDDLDLDLFWSTEFGPNRVIRNDGPTQDGWVNFTNLDGKANVEFPANAMGTGVLDVDGNGLMDLSVSNLWGGPPQRESLLLNRGGLKFKDVAGLRGAYAMIQARDTPFARGTSWGINAIDAENDGDQDLYIVYGPLAALQSRKDLGEVVTGNGYPATHHKQPNALLLNDGSGQFLTTDGTCAEGRGRGRGVAKGDLNGDGCRDLIVSNQQGPVRVLENRCEDAGHFLQLRLVGTRSSRDPVGAQVTITTDDGEQRRQVLAGSRGVHSSSPRRVHFGVGTAERIDRIRVRWPSGEEQSFRDVAVDQRLVVREPK